MVFVKINSFLHDGYMYINVFRRFFYKLKYKYLSSEIVLVAAVLFLPMSLSIGSPSITCFWDIGSVALL